MRVTATYKLSPTLDVDGDGIADTWETTSFGGTAAASATTDTDHDGTTDLEEYLAGTDATNPTSRFCITQVSTGANGETVIQWPAVIGKTYTLLTSSTLSGDDWTPIAVGIPGTAPISTYSVRMNGGSGFLRVQLE